MERRICEEPAPSGERGFSGLEKTGSFVSFATERSLHLAVVARMNPAKKTEFLANLLMLADYLSSDRTYNEVGRKYQTNAQDEISLTKIMQGRLRRTLRRLYDKAPMYMQEMFGPFGGFSFRKPVSVRTRIKLSEAKGSIKHIIHPHALEGSPVRQIAIYTGLDAKQVSSALYRERKRLNLEVPGQEKRNLVQKLKNPPRSKQQRQDLLNEVTYGIFRKNRKLFVSASEFFRLLNSQAPAHKAFQSVVEGIKWFGIPITVISKDGQNRSVIFRRDAERIVKHVGAGKFCPEEETTGFAKIA